MIDWYFGKPRTGKSYKAMQYIYDNYIVSNGSQYRNILTNIGGFNFEKINNIFMSKGSQSLAYHIVWKNLHNHLKKMYEMALDEKSDEELNRYADYHKINDSLIIIDEAFRFMKKYDASISWFLSYHGHFRIKLIFITQSPKQIYSEYLEHTEIFYQAQPQLKRIRDNKIHYRLYDEPPTKSVKHFSSQSIVTNQAIFDLYKSGEVDKPKKEIYKYIFFIVLALLFTIYSFWNVFHSFGTRTNQDVNQTVQNEQSHISINKHIIDPSLQSITLRCDNNFCWNQNPQYQDNIISIKYLLFLLDKFDIDILYQETLNEIYVLKKLKKGQTKNVLASLTDFHLSIPKRLKTSYLSDLFIPIKEDNSQELKQSKNMFSMTKSSQNHDERLSED